MNWVEVAKTLPIGGRRKVLHCTSDPTAHVHNDHDRMWIYCHRCKTHEVQHVAGRTLSDYSRLREHEHALQSRTVRMPEGVSMVSAPAAANVWLLRAGLTPERASAVYGFRWNTSIERVCMPVRNVSGLVGVVARAVDGRKPKYMVLSGTPHVYHLPQEGSRTLVFVEDILSAIKVRDRAGYPSAAVLGTTMDSAHAVNLIQHGGYDEAVILMDPDTAGRGGAIKVRKALALTPIRVRIATVPVDPKYMQTADIQALVKG